MRAVSVSAIFLALSSFVLTSLAAAPETAARWTVTPMAFCRYDVDVHDITGGYDQLGKATDAGVSAAAVHSATQITCPFLVGRDIQAQVYIARPGTTCTPADLPSVRVTTATRLSVHDFNQQIRCAAFLKSTPPVSQNAPGGAYLLVMPWLWNPTSPRGQFEPQVANRITQLVWTEGYPVSYFDAGGDGKSYYICFEMLKGASMDPFQYFKAVHLIFPVGTHELSSSTNCDGLERKAGYSPATRSWGSGDEPFKVQLRPSTNSPAGDAFIAAFSAAFEAAGLPAPPPDHGTYNPLVAGDARQVVVERLTSQEATFEVRALTPKVCEAAFAALTKLDAFIPPIDDESPTIVPVGTKGGPPPRYHALALVEVDSPARLCAALEPAMKRRMAPNGGSL